MKTTIEIHDELFTRAKRHARQTGRSLRSVVEEGIRSVLSAAAAGKPYKLPDLSIGDPNDSDPLEAYSWQDLSEAIYEQPGDPDS